MRSLRIALATRFAGDCRVHDAPPSRPPSPLNRPSPAAIMLPYPSAALGLEVTFIFLYLVVEFTRLYLGGCGLAAESRQWRESWKE